MATKPIDAHRGLRIESPLGDDLICRAFSGQEKLGRLFDYHLELLSPNSAIEFRKIVGQRVTVVLELHQGGERHFDGFVTEFRYAGTSGQFARYQARVRPWLWFLTQTSDCRIFQNQKVPDIISAIFSEHGFSDVVSKLDAGNYRDWPYCVQYRETDFNFISRLMEQEGIYYYFEHEAGKHTLVLADGLSAHEPFPGYEEIPYYPPDSNQALREKDQIQNWTVAQSIVPGKYAITDFDFEKPKVDLIAKLSKRGEHASPLGDDEIFDYPGEYSEISDGDRYVERKLQELRSQHERVQAFGNARGVAAGCLFTLRNPSKVDGERIREGEFLVISVAHDIEIDPLETSRAGEGGEFYNCRIEVMDSAQPYRSERITPKPVVQGPQTAIVVGPSSEEIYCDEYGRVKVQFHWDRYGSNDENSSCFVRVSQLWAGKAWGGIHIPRIGQEVLVSFLEGDPDQPLITGRVYNAVNMPPYDMPANKTRRGIKSRSSKGGSSKDYNEFRFEDKKGKEEVYLHAEKDLNTVVENNEQRQTFNTRKTIVGTDDNHRPGEPIEEVLIHGMRVINVRGNDGLVVKEGDKGRKVEIQDGSYELDIQKVNYINTIQMGDATVEAKMGKITIKAMTSIELICGSSSIKIDPTGVTIKGTLVNSEAAAINTIKGGLVKIN
jgi:type VI secretion system secreted protein VgrG